MDDYLRPIESRDKILDSYKSYLLSTFRTDNEDFNSQIRKMVNNDYQFVKGPYIQLIENYKQGQTISELTDTLLSKEFLKLKSGTFNPGTMRLYIHQVNALNNIIANDRSTVVSTGTGSGKTESFLFPIFNYLMREKEAGTLSKKGVRAMIIYPMNALVNDQIKRLRGYLENYPDITFGFFTGETSDMKTDNDYKNRFGCEPLSNEVFKREDMRTAPPQILITNYVMLERILIKPENSIKIFDKGTNSLWKYIVLDEAHSYSGAKGTEISMLLRRVRATLKNDKVRFILTSATLGSEKTNDQVAEFANNLTGSEEIVESDIVRACKDPPIRPDYLRSVPIKEYEALLEGMGDSETENQKISVKIGEILLSDERFWKIRDVLKDGAMRFEDVCSDTGLSHDELSRFINAASHGLRDGRKVFDAKYHIFMRSLEGVFVSLYPSNKVTFNTTMEIVDSELKEKFVTYQISSCYNCNAIYIPGSVVNGTLYGIVSKSNNISEDSPISLFMLSDEDRFNLAEDTTNFYRVCSKCGHINPYLEGVCECGAKYSNVVEKVVEDPVRPKLCKCPKCNSVNTKFGIVRDFYLGPEAASSVIGSALFMSLPHPPLHKKKVKQMLLFSDSRKSASYAAVNLGKTHENLLMHRVIVDVFSRYKEQFENGMIYSRLAKYVIEETMRIYNVEDDDDEAIDKCTEIAKRALLMEFAGSGSNKSLEYNGFFHFASKVKFEYPDLTDDELYNLVNQCLKMIREKGAVSSDYIQDKDLKDLFPGREKIIKEPIKGVTAAVFATKPVKRYLDKVFGGDESKSKRFIDVLFTNMMESDAGKYTLNADKQLALSTDGYYLCRHCHKRTPFSVRSICPACGEIGLEEKKTDFDTSEDHYVRLYRSMELEPLIVEEHTAQLSKELLSKYQKRFQEQKINAISSSTTFEMGIDIGSLTTVFMRNMPPSPSNYIQRAGRAGRSVSSSAFILTFCKNSSHDKYFFEDPPRMIEGEVKTPIVNINNPKIAIRHIYASALGYYWKYKGVSPQLVKDFTKEDYLDSMKKYFESPPEPLKSFLSSFVPKDLQSYSSEEVTIDLENNGWVSGIIGENGRLDVLLDEYESDISNLKEMEKEAVDSRNYNAADAVSRILSKKENKDTIQFLSEGNIIPKYGFPVDTIKLEPYYSARRKKSDYDIQRDLSMGISELAPGCQVVANGNLITSYSLKRPINQDLDRYAYVKCPECGTFSMLRFITKDDDNYPKFIVCENCGISVETSGNDCIIVPEFGFQYMDDKVTRASINKPKASRGVVIEYKGNARRHPEEFSINSLTGTLEHNIDDELAVVSNDIYKICDTCGFGTNDIYKSIPSHNNIRGKRCSNLVLRNYHLGYTLRTDVTILHLDYRSFLDYDGYLSVLYSLMEGMALASDIDRGEIDGCLRTTRNGYDFVFFDTTPGGAGYVKTLTVETLPSVIEQSIALLEGCDCGGSEGDGSCYGCLRNFKNQKYHELLKRGLALGYLREVRRLMDDV